MDSGSIRGIKSTERSAEWGVTSLTRRTDCGSVSSVDLFSGISRHLNSFFVSQYFQGSRTHSFSDVHFLYFIPHGSPILEHRGSLRSPQAAAPVKRSPIQHFQDLRLNKRLEGLQSNLHVTDLRLKCRGLFEPISSLASTARFPRAMDDHRSLTRSSSGLIPHATGFVLSTLSK